MALFSIHLYMMCVCYSFTYYVQSTYVACVVVGYSTRRAMLFAVNYTARHAGRQYLIFKYHLYLN